MFCPNCGKEMSDSAAFCGNCGYAKSSAPAPSNDVAQNSGSAAADDVLDLTNEDFTSVGGATSNNAPVQNNSVPNYNNMPNNNTQYNNAPNYNNNMPNYNNNMPNYNNVPNYNNNMPNYNNAPNYNNNMPNYNNAPNYNNNRPNYNMPNYNGNYRPGYNGMPYNYNQQNKKGASIIGVIGAILALVGCFLPLVGKRGSIVDCIKQTFDLAKIQYMPNDVRIKTIAALAVLVLLVLFFVLGLIFDLTGKRAAARVFGIINLVFLLVVLCAPIIQDISVIDIMREFHVMPGPGLILMLLGSLGIIISV